jgi:hypothetical protein
MTYVLHALIAQEHVLDSLAARFQNAHVVRLKQGIALVPVTEVLQEEIDGGRLPQSSDANTMFYELSNALECVCIDCSANGAVAYVEIEYFGGLGFQTTAVWDAGDIIFGPYKAGDEPGEPNMVMNPPLSEMPCNKALRLLGVKSRQGKDEFATVGLDTRRRTEQWIPESGEGGTSEQ